MRPRASLTASITAFASGCATPGTWPDAVTATRTSAPEPAAHPARSAGDGFELRREDPAPLQPRGTFELGYLVELVVPQQPAHRLDQIAIGRGVMEFAEGLAEVVRQRAMVVTVDVGIGRYLVGAAPGDQECPMLARAPAEAPDRSLCARSMVDARRWAHESLANRSWATWEVPQAGSGMAAVEHHRQVHAFREVL